MTSTESSATAGADRRNRAEIKDALWENHASHPLQDVQTLSGLCLLLRRSVFDALGGFDARGAGPSALAAYIDDRGASLDHRKSRLGGSVGIAIRAAIGE